MIKHERPQMRRLMAVPLLLASAVVGAAALPAQAATQHDQGGAAFTNSSQPVVADAVRAYPGTTVPAGAVRADDLPNVVQAQFATLTATPAPAAIGSTITISGTLTGLTNSGWVPLPTQTVTFTDTGDPSEAIASATTDANGNFTTTAIVTGTLGSPYEVQASWTDPQNAGVQANDWLTIQTPSVAGLSDFTVAYSPYGDITAQGTIAESNRAVPPGSLDLQFSANGSTGWKTIKKIAWAGSVEFNTTFFYGQSGYWRAFYPGDSSHLAATSPVRKAWRWSTYTSKISASAHRVSPHGRLTIAGSLYRYTSIGHKSAYKSEWVEVIFHLTGKKTWYKFGWAKTNSKGHFSFTGHVYGSATYLVIFPGGSGTFACQSPNTLTVTT
jgi:hypothetical protein